MKPLNVLILIIMMLPNVVMASKPVIVLNITGQPPLNTNNQAGFMDVVATEAFRRIGYQLKTVRLPAERGLVNSNRGLVDGEMSRIKNIDKLYTNLIRVPEKIMNWEFVGFAIKPISLQQGWSALSNKSVSHINGWKILEKNIPDTAETTRTKDADSLFNLLRRNRTDIVLYERWGGQYLLQEKNMNKVQLCDKPLAVKEMYIYLHKNHKPLVSKLASALKEMKQDGSYTDIHDKYLKKYEK